MDTSQGLLLAIVWVFLRFGLPVLGTGLIIYIFSRLDSGWKKEALAFKRDLVGEGVIPLIKCWVFNDCPPEKRQECLAYQEKLVPCWQLFRDENENLQEDCLDCAVFHTATIPILN